MEKAVLATTTPTQPPATPPDTTQMAHDAVVDRFIAEIGDVPGITLEDVDALAKISRERLGGLDARTTLQIANQAIAFGTDAPTVKKYHEVMEESGITQRSDWAELQAAANSVVTAPHVGKAVVELADPEVTLHLFRNPEVVIRSTPRTRLRYRLS